MDKAHASSNFSRPQGSLLTTFLFVVFDYVCPYSAKMFKTVYTQVLPKISGSKYYNENLQIIMRPQIQPWHPSSQLTIESGLAVLELAPEKFWQYSEALFEKQKEYFDIPVVNEPRNETYKRLSKLANQSVGVDEGKMYDLLKIPEKAGPDGALNVGNQVQNETKRTIKVRYYNDTDVVPEPHGSRRAASAVHGKWRAWEEQVQKSACQKRLDQTFANPCSPPQYTRLVGIHVTPSVIFDGVVEGSISSSFTADQWVEWLEKNIV